MDSEIKRDFRFALIASILVIIFLSLSKCSKLEDQAQNDIQDQISSMYEDQPMNPGPDPSFIDASTNNGLYGVLKNIPLTTAAWERYMYVDRTDTLYNNTQGKNTFSKYVKRYGFNGVYLYSTSGIVSSTSNYTNFSSFLKQLTDSGIVYRAIAAGSSTAFTSSGNVTRYNQSQTDPAKRINRANLELEWWNGATTWSNWNTINQQIAAGTIIDNDFYEGWYLNLGGTIDTIAARDQVRYSDRILLHAYQNGIPTYSYVGGRLDVIAKGARQVNKMANVYIIISAENTAWGAANTFTGPALAAASSQSNPYEYIETQAYNNIYGGMSVFQKQWIRIRGFVWFTKRFCYAAIPPR